MKRFTLLGIAALFALNTTVFAQRGQVIWSSPLLTASPDEIMANLQLQMPGINYSLIDYFTYKKYSVQAIKIIYTTIDGKGFPTTASGVVFLPAVTSTTQMPVFTYLHGTLTRDLDAPSMLKGIESVIGWIMAMDGYIAIEPDYLGMGDGSGIHPYLHADSEASASVDMMKAVMEFCSSSGVNSKPNGNLYLSGYSQGAHAALATQRELQAHPLPGLSLRKTIAGSGAYSLSSIQKKYVFDHPDYINPSFIPYLLLGYQNVYGNLWSNIDKVFVPPYSSTIPGLFNGQYTVDEIDNQLPITWKSMFVPSYLSDFQYKYFNPINTALRANDVINWKPVSDLHLYFCTCDEQVANENSLLAYLMFLLKGSRKVTCLPIGPFSHFDCAPFVLLLAKIHSDCASGANPCGFEKPLPLDLAKSSDENDLAQFRETLTGTGTIDLKSVYANKLVSEYVDNASTKERTLSLYPNPASDMIFVEIPDEVFENSQICIYNILGTKLFSENVDRSVIQIDVSAFPSGLYKVVITGLNTFTGTLVVNR
jgi:hypothetical protein